MKLNFCIFFAVLMVLGAAPQSVLAQTSATVTTDQSDYPPGSTVNITGSGFAPGEIVQLQVVNLTNPGDSGPEHDPWTITNGPDGNFTTTWYVTEDEANTTLQLTAIGLTSHLVAQTIFTDAAQVNLTVATGGSGISADFTGGSYTNLTNPVLAETAKNAIGTGTIVLNAPVGFRFDTTANSVTATVTGGTLSQTLQLGTSSGSQTQTVTPTTNTVTINVFATSGGGGGVPSTITWTGIKVRPTSGTSLASGNITESGTSSFTYNTGSAANYGTLTEVPGAAAKLAFGVQPSTTTAGNSISPSVTVLVQDQFGNTKTNDSSTVTIGSGTTAFTGSTLSVAAASGVATFSNIKPTTASSTNTLTASDGSLTGATSSTFTVNATTATKLAFVTMPAGAVYKTAFTTQPVVQTQDTYGNNSTVGLGATVTATLSLTNGTGPLVGTTNLNIGTSGGNGTASYSGLQINKAENGDALNATATGFTGATSGSFNVSKANLTLTPGTNVKTYDGTTSATNVPAASGLLGGDTVSGTTVVYDTANAGTGKTLSITAYTVNDGNGGNNYNVSTPTSTGGSINKATTTATLAVANSPVTYDGTGKSATVSVTSSNTPGSVQNILTGGQTLQTNAGTYGVTADYVPANTNYTTLSSVAVGSFVINQAASSVSYSAIGPFTYNKTAKSPNIGFSGSTGVKTTNYVGTSLSYASVNAPTNAGTYYVSNTVAANSNYLGATNSQSFTINATNLTITAQANTKVYDGGTSSATNAAITAGSIQSGDSAPTWTQTFDNKNAGTGKTLTPSSLVVTDGNSGNNYNYTYTAAAVGVINKATTTATLAVANSPVTYDGTGKSATVSVTSSNTPGSVQNILTGGQTLQTNAGTYAVTADYVPTDTNYTTLSGMTVTGSFDINQASTAVSINSSAQTNGYRDSVYFTATNLPADATLNVVFLANGVAFSTNALSNGGAASLAITNLPRGTNIISAEYAGDGNYIGSTNTLTGGQVVTNHPPVAGSFSYTNTTSTFKVAISNLLTHASDVDGDTIALTGFSTSTNGVSIVTNATLFQYRDTNYVNDVFNYMVNDGHGGSATGTISIVFNPFASTGQNGTVSPVVGGSVNLTYHGIPNYSYGIQRSTNMVSWTIILTTNTPSNGVFSYTDTFSDLGAPPASAYYRLIWNP